MFCSTFSVSALRRSKQTWLRKTRHDLIHFESLKSISSFHLFVQRETTTSNIQHNLYKFMTFSFYLSFCLYLLSLSLTLSKTLFWDWHQQQQCWFCTKPYYSRTSALSKHVSQASVIWKQMQFLCNYIYKHFSAVVRGFVCTFTFVSENHFLGFDNPQRIPDDPKCPILYQFSTF